MSTRIDPDEGTAALDTLCGHFLGGEGSCRLESRVSTVNVFGSIRRCAIIELLSCVRHRQRVIFFIIHSHWWRWTDLLFFLFHNYLFLQRSFGLMGVLWECFAGSWTLNRRLCMFVLVLGILWELFRLSWEDYKILRIKKIIIIEGVP